MPLLSPVAADLYSALRRGMAFADDIAADTHGDGRGWFWAHCARHQALLELRSSQRREYSVLTGVPNDGIHIRVGDLHTVRVLRSFGGTTPHPGPGRRRQKDWSNQLQFMLDDRTLPPLSLIADWQVADGEPAIHIGVPRRAWKYLLAPDLHWRAPLPDVGAEDFASLRFSPPQDTEQLVRLRIDQTEAPGLGGAG